MSALSKVAKATGLRSGDYLELHNQWAKVVITFEPDEDGDLPPIYVNGDILETGGWNRRPGYRAYFETWADALAFAFDSLASFERGRAS